MSRQRASDVRDDARTITTDDRNCKGGHSQTVEGSARFALSSGSLAKA